MYIQTECNTKHFFYIHISYLPAKGNTVLGPSPAKCSTMFRKTWAGSLQRFFFLNFQSSFRTSPKVIGGLRSINWLIALRTDCRFATHSHMTITAHYIKCALFTSAITKWVTRWQVPSMTSLLLFTVSFQLTGETYCYIYNVKSNRIEDFENRDTPALYDLPGFTSDSLFAGSILLRNTWNSGGIVVSKMIVICVRTDPVAPLEN